MVSIESLARSLCETRDPDDRLGGPHPSGIWLDKGEPWWTGYINQVESVLQQIVQPDGAMLDAGVLHMPYGFSDPDGSRDELLRAYREMIGVVLATAPNKH